MKINFSYAFNKRLYTPFLSFLCTLFAFFMVISHANAQCPSGVTISMSYTVDNSTGIPIPFCTPFKVTTTVKNTTAAQKTIDFIRTAYEPGTFEIICLDNTADAVGIGIRAVNNNFNQSYIYANNIRAKIGILSSFNKLNIGNIYNNEIDVTANPSTPWASLGIIGFDNSVTGNWNIYENFINVQNAQGGMQFNSGIGATLTNNAIVLGTTSLSNANGIQAGGSTNFSVSCNTISYFGNPNPFYRSGMYVSSGTGSSYTCNNTMNTVHHLGYVASFMAAYLI